MSEAAELNDPTSAATAEPLSAGSRTAVGPEGFDTAPPAARVVADTGRLHQELRCLASRAASAGSKQALNSNESDQSL